jgi:hypothetical protein
MNEAAAESMVAISTANTLNRAKHNPEARAASIIANIQASSRN